MSILYSSVARGSTILVSHKNEEKRLSRDFESVILSILKNIPKENGKYSYNAEADSTAFHVLVHDEFTYLCLAIEMLSQSIAYNFLNEIRNRFQPEHFRRRALSAGPNGMKHMFGHILDSITGHYNAIYKNEAGDNVDEVFDKIEEVKDVMTENVGKVLERGECLDALLIRADGIKQDHLVKFQRHNRTSLVGTIG
ncbi:uncharacterized protein TRIADDRAFT_59655 [Trichoplax adhaerens]|uniref:Longin domain-containing protein n=1 Tax=Trichoplax adhaerens TaxID=10228 RepID=B3S628_TRIAD|nr:hypothetical protein TRIADDRAFT_59655 [Trichoplax adhaerens]EDV21547.1 hypothetical protein TRIADDRAFT_59655 [Trichoplax adhaerens]|eukprot:XP_002115695.1 hypothetical protein TRIADDRAFT_59655 [Trichoplax adhaerens]